MPNQTKTYRMKPHALAAGMLFLAVPLTAADFATKTDWPSYGGTHSALRYSALDQINAANVQKLAPVWMFQTGDKESGLEATPIVIDGVMYLSSASNWVFALAADTGRLLWEYRFPLPAAFQPIYGRQNRGVAVGQGRVFMGTADNHVVALDQKTGTELWRVNVEDERQCGCNITGAPLVVKDLVITGVTGGDSAHRGYLTAFDARTGRMRWRFYTIPAPGEKGSETWPGESWRFGGGATWMTGSYDPDLDLLYWGVGNAAADLNATHRRGDNLYTCSIVALDPATGGLKWHYQEVPQDMWDYDAAFELILADIPLGGQTRKVLMQPNKTGYVWMIDRVTGRFLKAWRFANQVNWVTGITEEGKLVGRLEPEIGKTKLVCPSAIGAKNWNQSAYSLRTGWLYIPVQEICNDLTARDDEGSEGRPFIGGDWQMKPPPGGRMEGYIAAYDAVTGERKWTALATTWILASVLATAGDVVFSGDPEGFFFALDARTGKRLWSFQTGGGHRGSAVTYSVNGRQYVATPSGWGSVVGAAHHAFWPDRPAPQGGSALVVFALPQELAR
ncbi:MAG: PQQ-dependent dehydrogenase, methanol/ethanol family [Acidobacteriia bacterium]|nr:PQQ-dependent dehydrogenase, methanol/ethanol family [Terriglobia bacterium]